MIIDKVREYLMTCPILDELSKINVDYLGTDAQEYTIDVVPATAVIKQYVDGGALKQFVFIFGSREYYGSDTLQNIENSGFYESFAKWLAAQTKEGALPELEGGLEAQSIEALTSGYLFDTTEDNARYQIQARLIYYEN